MRTWLNRNPITIVFVLFALTVATAFWIIQSDDEERKEQICISALEHRIVLGDLVKFSTESTQAVDPTLPENIRKLIEEGRVRSQDFRDKSLAKLEIPPAICEDTDVDPADVRRDLNRRSS